MNQFQDHEFMTAREKDLVLKTWEKFITNGFQDKHFTKKLYLHISLHCSFIAHYDRAGFYGTYFSNLHDTLKFLGQFDPDGEQMSVEYGYRGWLTDDTAGDLNHAMCRVFKENKMAIMGPLNERVKEQDLHEATALEDRANLLRAQHA